MIEAKLYIADRRKAAGLSQLDLAAELFTSQSNISSWERGKTTPNALTLPTIAHILGCSIDDLYKKSEGGIEDGAHH